MSELMRWLSGNGHTVDAKWDDITDTAMWRCGDCPAGAVGFETLDDAYTDALAHADGAE